MNFIIKPRGYGKTTDIINLAFYNDGIILTATESSKRFLKDSAKRLYPNEEIPVYSINDLKKHCVPERKKTYIDETDSLLEQLLLEYKLNLEVGTLTLKEC